MILPTSTDKNSDSSDLHQSPVHVLFGSSQLSFWEPEAGRATWCSNLVVCDVGPHPANRLEFFDLSAYICGNSKARMNNTLTLKPGDVHRFHHFDQLVIKMPVLAWTLGRYIVCGKSLLLWYFNNPHILLSLKI